MIFLTWLTGNLLFFNWLGDKSDEREFYRYMRYRDKYERRK